MQPSKKYSKKTCTNSTDCQKFHTFSKCVYKSVKSSTGFCRCNYDCSYFEYFPVCGYVKKFENFYEFGNYCEVYLLECKYGVFVDVKCAGQECDCEGEETRLTTKAKLSANTNFPVTSTCQNQENSLLCNNNGVCVKNIMTNQKFCHCNINFRGQYCQVMQSAKSFGLDSPRISEERLPLQPNLMENCQYGNFHMTIIFLVLFYTIMIVYLLVKLTESRLLVGAGRPSIVGSLEEARSRSNSRAVSLGPRQNDTGPLSTLKNLTWPCRRRSSIETAIIPAGIALGPALSRPEAAPQVNKLGLLPVPSPYHHGSSSYSSGGNSGSYLGPILGPGRYSLNSHGHPSLGLDPNNQPRLRVHSSSKVLVNKSLPDIVSGEDQKSLKYRSNSHLGSQMSVYSRSAPPDAKPIVVRQRSNVSAGAGLTAEKLAARQRWSLVKRKMVVEGRR